jgi:hypothetical protein
MGSYWHELPIEPVSAAVDHRTVRLNVGLWDAIPVQVLGDLPAVPVTMHGHASIVLGHRLPQVDGCGPPLTQPLCETHWD